MPAPTLVSYTESTWNTGGSLNKKTVSISYNSGDVVAAIAGSEAATTLTAIAGGTGLSWTNQQTNSTASTCGMICAAAVAASSQTAQTITLTLGNNIDHCGFGVWVVRNSQGIGASASSHTTAKTVGLTPLGGADGLIIYATFDFAAAALQTITPTPSDTRQRVVDGTSYTIYVSDLLDQTSAGAVNYGISGTGSGPFTNVAFEFKAAAGGGFTPKFRKTLSLVGTGVGKRQSQIA